jgi:hypothetical protein
MGQGRQLDMSKMDAHGCLRLYVLIWRLMGRLRETLQRQIADFLEFGGLIIWLGKGPLSAQALHCRMLWRISFHPTDSGRSGFAAGTGLHAPELQSASAVEIVSVVASGSHGGSQTFLPEPSGSRPDR